MRIRMAGLEDAAALLAIYAPYVRETAITFEYDVPSEKEFAGRIAHTLEKFPYLVAENDGEIVGYAYAGAFHPRAAYQWCAEMSVYVKRDARRMGVGRKLYDAMETILSMQRLTNVEACIAVPSAPDAHLTRRAAYAQHAGTHPPPDCGCQQSQSARHPRYGEPRHARNRRARSADGDFGACAFLLRQTDLRAARERRSV